MEVFYLFITNSSFNGNLFSICLSIDHFPEIYVSVVLFTEVLLQKLTSTYLTAMLTLATNASNFAALWHLFNENVMVVFTTCAHSIQTASYASYAKQRCRDVRHNTAYPSDLR